MQYINGRLHIKEHCSDLVVRQWNRILLIFRLQQCRHDVAQNKRLVALENDRLLFKKPFMCRLKLVERLFVAGQRSAYSMSRSEIRRIFFPRFSNMR